MANKKKLKKKIIGKQGGVFTSTGLESGAVTDEDLSLVDSDRIVPKAANGTYVESNTMVMEPTARMARHGVLRTRDEQLELLKSTFDDRVQTMKLMLKIQNQLGAYERRVDHKHPDTEQFLNAQIVPVKKRLDEIDKELASLVKFYDDPLSKVALQVPGLGPVTVAALAVYVDFHKQVCSVCRFDPNKEVGKGGCECPEGPHAVTAASTPSSLWKYVGLDKASHQRYEKGKAGGGNKTLRTVLWNSANVMMKLRTSGYREVYDRTKNRLAISEKSVSTRNTLGKLVEIPWKDAKPSHRHGAALRAIMKHLLADYWMVGRTLYKMPTVPLYAESMLGHTHIISPRERGWKY